MKRLILALLLVIGLSPLALAQDLADWQQGCIPFMGGDNKWHCDWANFAFDSINDQLIFGASNYTGTTAELNTAFDLTSGVETLAATELLTVADCGKTFFLNHATEFATTLPAVTAGCKLTFITGAAPVGANYTIVTPALADLLIGGINELAVVTTSDMPYVTTGDTITFTASAGVVGDWLYMISDGTKWYIRGQANAATGIEPTDAD